MLRDAFEGSIEAFDGYVIDPLGLEIHRYNGRVDQKLMVEALGAIQKGVPVLLRKAETTRERTGNTRTHCLAATIVDVYNKAAKLKLAPWWKADTTS